MHIWPQDAALRQVERTTYAPYRRNVPMLGELLGIVSTRNSLRGALVRRLIRRLAFIPYPLRLSVDAVERAHDGYCVFHAARQAKFLGLKQISVLEFGVAGGNGLINLEYHAIETKKHLDIDVE